jgi:histone H2A
MATPRSGKKAGASKGGKKGNRSARAGLIFPVGRVSSMLRSGSYARRVAAGSGVYLASVVEYLATELLELAVKASKHHGFKRITPRAITLAVRNDAELGALLQNVTLARGGVAGKVHDVLEKKKKSKGSKKSSATPKV